MSKRTTHFIGIMIFLGLGLVFFVSSLLILSFIATLGAVFLAYLLGKFTREIETDQSFELHYWRKKHAIMTEELAFYRQRSMAFIRTPDAPRATNDSREIRSDTGEDGTTST